MTLINAQTPDANAPSFQNSFSKISLMTWLAAGSTVWLVATLGLAWLGDHFIESGLAVYIVFSLAACGAFIGIFAFLAKKLRLSESALLPAAATFSIAGM